MNATPANTGRAFRFPLRDALFIVALTLILRALLLGGAPFTDEGIHVAAARLESAGGAAHPNTPLAIYPKFLGLLVGRHANGIRRFIVFRILDGIVASGAGLAFYFFLRRWLPSRFALTGATFWVLAFNFPIFIDAGFKNSIGAACVCLNLALLLLSYSGAFCLVSGGAALGLAMLIREPFVFHILATLYLAWRLNGRRGVLLFVAGLAGVLLLAAVVLTSRGMTPSYLFDYYAATRRLYQSDLASVGVSAGDRLWQASSRFILACLWLAPPTLIGFAGWAIKLKKGTSDPACVAALWLLLASAPELMNFPLPYHAAQLALGSSVLAAFGIWRFEEWLCSLKRVKAKGDPRGAAFVLMGILCLSLSIPYWRTSEIALKNSFHFWPVMMRGDWNSKLIQESFYLDTASRIRSLTKKDGTLVVSGFYAGLYPLADRRPADPTIPDLTAFVMRGEAENRARLDELRNAAPRLIVETTRFPLDLPALFPGFESEYHLAADIPEGTHRSYGNFGARLWMRNQE